MELSSLRPPLQLALCAGLVHRLTTPSFSLAIETLLSVFLYLFISVFVVLPFHFFVYLPFLSPLRKIPSPPSGLNTWRTWLAAEPTPPQLLAWVDAAAKLHGDDFHGVMRYYGIGGSERILLTSSEAFREVLVSKQYEYFDRPTMARKRIAVQAGNGLIASGGDVHKGQKRKLLPAFSGRAIKDLYPLFCSKANELVVALRKETQTSSSASAVVEIVSWTSRSALDIIGVAAWGRDFDAISEPNSTFLKSYSAMFDISGGGQLINALALALPMSIVSQIPCAYNKRLKTALKSVRLRCADIVRQKKEKTATEKEESRTQDSDILSLLIRSGIDDDEVLINQMMTMLAAGHDTSSLTLAWACHVLCKHPDVQRRLREEVQTKLPVVSSGFEEGNITPETFDNLPYLNAVANETLRLMPAVPITRRETLESTTIQGYYVPRGGHIVVSGYLANRIESEWGSDAEEFKPDRWLPRNREESEQENNRGVNNKFAFHSFSHGPRSCIGQGFARGELLVLLAALVAGFEMEMENAEEEPVALFGITMSPEGGIRIKLKQAS